MKKIPIFISDFAQMIQEDYLYVDKTQHLYQLVKEKGYYFLSRPRRFGKSLLVSTLKQLFLGNKYLFEKLWIDSSDYQWQEYPVIHLDFSIIDHESADALRSNLAWKLKQIAQDYGINISEAPSLSAMLEMLVVELSKKKNKVIILIDEYDKPILDHLTVIENAKMQRDVLRSFYAVIKGLDAYLYFVLLTGVSKFSKTSIFSGLNNLNDISMKPEAAALLGYTEDELKKYFAGYIDIIAQERETSKQVIMQEMKVWYDGYRFSRQKTLVYNPFSVLYYLKDKELSNYWFESGTPSFLIELLKKEYDVLDDIDQIEWSSETLGTFDIDYIHLVIVLFQTGYLTIADYDKYTRKYILNYPNQETRDSFQKYVLAALVNSNFQSIERGISQLRNALKNNDVHQFCIILQSIFAHIPYHLHIAQERYYHSLFQLMGNLIGMDMQSEIATDKGRIDLVITTKTHIYIFELKFKKDADTALAQIQTQKYYERYVLQKKKEIVLVGLSFNHDNNKLSVECVSQPL